jgi:hypothetical protein
MPKRIFTVTFDVADDEFENFMTRLAGGAVLSNEIPRNTKVNTGDAGEDDEGPADANAPAINELGVPWDARYHGKAKNINADKSWKRIKGLSDALKAEADAFEAAAKAAFAATPVQVVEATAPVVVETALPVVVAETAAPVVGLPVTAPVGLPTGIPGLPMPVAVVTPPPVTYEEVVALFGAVAATHPSVVPNYLAIYAECGIDDANKLTNDETLRRKLFDKLTEISKTPAQVAA